MELSLELIHSVLSTLKGDPRELRKHPRAPLRIKLKIIPFVKGVLGEPLEIWTRDLSAGGLGLSSRKEIEVGSRFIIRLPHTSRGQVHLLCHARNCQEVSKGAFVIGATFVEVESEAKPAAAGAPNELTKEVLRISSAILS